MITRLEQKYSTIQHKTRTIQGEQSKNHENYHYNYIKTWVQPSLFELGKNDWSWMKMLYKNTPICLIKYMWGS